MARSMRMWTGGLVETGMDVGPVMTMLALVNIPSTIVASAYGRNSVSASAIILEHDKVTLES